MMNLQQATLLIDKVRCIENIRAMISKAKKEGVTFRPHFKTHQSVEIGRWFRSEGVKAITVSSLDMAKQFASDQWSDITVAVTAHKNQAIEIDALANRIDLNILVEDVETVRSLSALLSSPVGVFVKVDTGLHRSGISVENIAEITSLMSEIKHAPHMIPKGLLTYSGQTHQAMNTDDVLAIHNHSVQAMRYVREALLSDFPNIKLSIGDTPSCKIAEDFDQISEIRPGSFVFNDCQQMNSGTCQFDEIAMLVAAPVIAKHDDRNEFVVHCGAVHLSKDTYLLENGMGSHGKIVLLDEAGQIIQATNGFVSSLSQEHGVVKASTELLDKISVGDFIGIVPAHCCLTNHLMKDHTLFVHSSKSLSKNDLRSKKEVYESI